MSSLKQSVQSAVFNAMTAAATFMQSGTSPWWMGVPTKLLAKTTLVPQHANHLPVHTLTFQIPDYNEHGAYFNTSGSPAVHHSQIRLAMGDVVKMVIPDYKPKSYSVSRLDDATFDVTFKVYPNGRASGYLDRLSVGDMVGSFGMQKPRQRNAGSFVNIIAYGVGITEAVPVAQAELNNRDVEQVTMLWASRTLGDTFWKDELSAMQQEFGKRFRLVHIFSREKVDGSLQGRINSDVLRTIFIQGKEDTATHRFLSVGTKEMMKQTDEMLASIGFPQPKHSLLV